MAKHINFLAIGDTTVDNFILLKDAHLFCNINNENCELCVKFGQKIPYINSTLVYATGNSANAAICARRLGLSSALVSSVGNDLNGKNCLNTLKEESIVRKFIKINKDGKPTNYHFVLRYEGERTILVKHESFDYFLPKKNTKVDWVYFSSIGEHSLPFHHEIVNWLKKKPETKLAFQPGTFQIKLGTDELKDIYGRTELFLSNKEEAQNILKTEEADIKELITGIHKLGPKKVVITDGKNGLNASDGENIYFLPMFPNPKAPVEATGAGDAASATIVVMLAMGMDFKKALTYGPINAMSVVQEIGAQKGLLNKAQIEKYLQNAPKDYFIQEIK